VENSESDDSTKSISVPVTDDTRDPSLPRFRLTTIREHHGTSGQPWVVHEDKVYDITDFVAGHPGGDVILRAAGGPVEPYWDIFTIHRGAPHVRELLSQYLIGFVDSADLGPDGRPAAKQIADPFAADPVRDARLVTHTARPRNAEPPAAELDAQFRTPNELFYVRNHMWVPQVADEEPSVATDISKEASSAAADAQATHTLTVELPDGETVEYTLADLQTRFRRHRVTATLQCSGNRRNDMTRHAGRTNGLQWGVGAIGNAEWEGVRLADVLADAGLTVTDPTSTTCPTTSDEPDSDAVEPTTHHVQFSGMEAYGASIPLSTALDPRADVLIAFKMNGLPLPRDHGYPLRALVPGHVAARSVKWLSRISVADEESTSQWQRRDYKSFGPNEGPKPDWDRAAPIQEMPVASAITSVWVGKGQQPGDSHAAGVGDIAAISTSVGATSLSGDQQPLPREPISLRGWAFSGGGREIRRVDVSLDDGRTWDQADLMDDCGHTGCKGSKHWAWKRWRYTGKLPTLEQQEDAARACTTVVVKATDDSYNTQPAHHRDVYNVRGNLATAWHRVRVCSTCRVDGNKVTWSTEKTGDADETLMLNEKKT
jgi:sulfite oxidase